MNYLKLFFPLAISLFGVAGESCKLGEPLGGTCYSPSYNAPARVMVQNPASFSMNVAFLYYYIQQTGLEIATSGTIVQMPNFSYATVVSDNQHLYFQPFEYNPCFKVSLRGSVDEWDISTEYTWLYSTTQGNFSPPSASFGSPVLVSHNWFQSLSMNNTPLSAVQIGSHWKFQGHVVDLIAQRPCYVGSYFVIKPFGGLRCAFLYQDLDITFTQALNTVPSMPPQPIYSVNHSSFWGIGPKLGTEGSLLLPKKFRIQSNIAWSLLNGHFDVTHYETAASTTQIPSPIEYSVTDQEYLRYIFEIGLGVGWASYIVDNRYHIDFSASYDFIQYEEQNMMKKILDGFLTQPAGSGQSLYLNGLNLNLWIDF